MPSMVGACIFQLHLVYMRTDNHHDVVDIIILFYKPSQPFHQITLTQIPCVSAACPCPLRVVAPNHSQPCARYLHAIVSCLSATAPCPSSIAPCLYATVPCLLHPVPSSFLHTVELLLHGVVPSFLCAAAPSFLHASAYYVSRSTAP